MLVVAGARTVAMGAAFDVSQTATEAAAAMVITNIIRFMMSSYWETNLIFRLRQTSTLI